jgi:hypothetical protein
MPRRPRRRHVCRRELARRLPLHAHKSPGGRSRRVSRLRPPGGEGAREAPPSGRGSRGRSRRLDSGAGIRPDLCLGRASSREIAVGVVGWSTKGAAWILGRAGIRSLYPPGRSGGSQSLGPTRGGSLSVVGWCQTCSENGWSKGQPRRTRNRVKISFIGEMKGTR